MSEGLTQGPYVVARAGFEPATPHDVNAIQHYT